MFFTKFSTITNISLFYEKVKERKFFLIIFGVWKDHPDAIPGCFWIKIIRLLQLRGIPVVPGGTKIVQHFCFFGQGRFLIFLFPLFL